MDRWGGAHLDHPRLSTLLTAPALPFLAFHVPLLYPLTSVPSPWPARPSHHRRCETGDGDNCVKIYASSDQGPQGASASSDDGPSPWHLLSSIEGAHAQVGVQRGREGNV